MSEKLQKALARSGLGSRREIETWIAEGRLSVNGEVANLGARVTIRDDIQLDGRKLRLLPETLITRKVLMYHKPEGQVTTRKDPEGRDTVFDNLPTLRGSRWIAIGRLDLNTSGLLLFTNDGELANRLMHPRHEVEREYAVRIMGELQPAQRKALLKGVTLDDGVAAFNTIESRGGTGANHWYHVTLKEGRTREVRRMFEAINLFVSRLIRVRYGPIQLDPGLKQAMMRELDKQELDALCAIVGLEPQGSRTERRKEVMQEKGRLHSEEKQERKQQRRVRDDEAPKVKRLSKLEQALKAVEEPASVSASAGRRRAAPVLRESEARKLAIKKQREVKAEAKPKRIGKAPRRDVESELESPRRRTRSDSTSATMSRASERSRGEERAPKTGRSNDLRGSKRASEKASGNRGTRTHAGREGSAGARATRDVKKPRR